MAKIYTYIGKRGKKAVTSLRQLAKLTGRTEKTLWRNLKHGEYGDKKSDFVVDMYELERDKRQYNGDPNIKNRIKGNTIKV